MLVAMDYWIIPKISLWITCFQCNEDCDANPGISCNMFPKMVKNPKVWLTIFCMCQCYLLLCVCFVCQSLFLAVFLSLCLCQTWLMHWPNFFCLSVHVPPANVENFYVEQLLCKYLEFFLLHYLFITQNIKERLSKRILKEYLSKTSNQVRGADIVARASVVSRSRVEGGRWLSL